MTHSSAEKYLIQKQMDSNMAALVGIGSRHKQVHILIWIIFWTGLWIRIRDPDRYWIRIQSGLWIRIRIRNPDPDPGGQNDPQK